MGVLSSDIVSMLAFITKITPTRKRNLEKNMNYWFGSSFGKMPKTTINQAKTVEPCRVHSLLTTNPKQARPRQSRTTYNQKINPINH
jgi:hypothetical protein